MDDDRLATTSSIILPIKHNRTLNTRGGTKFVRYAKNAIQIVRSPSEERDACILEMYKFESQDNVDHPTLCIPALKLRLQELGILSVDNLKVGEEQEREVSHEEEREGQVQRPQKVTPPNTPVWPVVSSRSGEPRQRLDCLCSETRDKKDSCFFSANLFGS